MDALPESMYLMDTVSRIYGIANDNVECRIKNIVFPNISALTNVVIWLKEVNGIKIIVFMRIEYNNIVYVKGFFRSHHVNYPKNCCSNTSDYSNTCNV